MHFCINRKSHKGYKDLKVRELLDVLNDISPFVLQEAWDNSGLNVGNKDNVIGDLFVSLDLDAQIIKNLPQNSTVITHHPLIFKPIKNIVSDFYPSNFLYELIQKNINLISLHTNYDKTHLNDYVAKNVLGWQDYEKTDFTIIKNGQWDFMDLANDVKQRFGLQNLNVVKTKRLIKRVGLTTGAGIGFFKDYDVDAYISGDVKYHDATQAQSLDVGLIDVTHHASEEFFAQSLENVLKNYDIFATILAFKNPFTLI